MIFGIETGRFLELAILLLNIIVAILLAIRGLPLSDAQIDAMTTTYPGGNPYLREELKRNRTLDRIGLAVLLLAIVFQVIRLLH